MKKIILIALFFAAVAYFFWAFKNKKKNSNSQEMTKDVAYDLVKSWVQFAREDLDCITIKDDSFYGQVGAPYFEYRDNVLIVRGLVYSDDKQAATVLPIMPALKQAEIDQAQRTAGGYFDRNMSKSKPDITLRRDFKDGNMSKKEFIKEVEDLMWASTWWRKTGFYQVLISIK